MGRLNIVIEMAIFLKFTFRFTAIAIKVPANFVVEMVSLS